ncbi:MAG: DNA polymerase III subunit delta' [Alphaproteobacteria bacterium]
MARRAVKPPVMDEVDEDHPRLASQCLDHVQPEAQFLEAYNAGRLHHAWLLHGPKGIGKATFAYRAAKFLLADDKSEEGGLFGAAAAPTNLDRSSDDPGCRRVAARSHADLFTAEPEKAGGQISAEAARNLIHSFQFTAGEGAWRVAIIDTADDLHRSAANILLKLIEEPPPRTVLFLISNNPGRLLPTIRSRCARVAFEPMADESVARILSMRRPDAEAEDMSAAVRLAGGSAGRGLSLLDGGGAVIIDALAMALNGRQGDGTLKAQVFAAQVAKNPFHYAIAGETLMAWLGTAARPPGSQSALGLTPDLIKSGQAAARLGPKPWMDLYAHAGHRLERVQAVNLDPVQTLVDILARAQALLARVSA